MWGWSATSNLRDYFLRSAVGPDSAGTQSATIEVGEGIFEVLYVHLITGAEVPIVGLPFFHMGEVLFERLDEYDESVFDLKKAQRILPRGQFTNFTPYISYERLIITGPGRFKSFVELPAGYTAQHTLTVLYRRVKD